MAAIDTQNAMQIRAPMSISCGIAARQNIGLTFSNITGFALQDTNPSVSLDTEEWPVKEITDLQGTGFPVDGSREFYVAGAGSEDGKLGLRTHIGGSGSFTVASSSEISALTFYTSGEGTITVDGTDYAALGVTVVPIGATSAAVSVQAANANERLEIHTIIPAINLSWDENTLISVELDLRSDLTMANAQWAVSEIEIKAYYPDDIAEAVSGISDDAPLWYSAGYTGNMSPERRFYVSEPVRMENNIITIRGHDISRKLAEKSYAAQVLNTKSGTGLYDLYLKMLHTIQDAGITLRSRESAPAKTSGTTERTLVFKAGSADKIVSDIMNLAHTGAFWPTFVDAGRPVLYHTKPVKKWTIREEDCGDVTRTADRNISRIRCTDANGLHNQARRNTKWKELMRLKVDADTSYVRNVGTYYWALSVSNAVDITTTAESIRWTSINETQERPMTKYEIDKNGNVKETNEITYIDECVIKGKSVDIKKLTNLVTASPKRTGITMDASPIAYGQVFNGDVFLYPNYSYLFRRSNITGSFTWKGDPRMQPRDVFEFQRLDGTTELCTIEEIVLRHEEGGTVATISYRQGVC